MKIQLATTEADAQLWEQFVNAHPHCSNYHLWGWKQVIENSFGWPTFYLMAAESGVIRGILPLACQKSWLFGTFLTSLPFLNGGGIVAETEDVASALLQEATGLAQQLRADYLELRQRRNDQLGLLTKTHKVALVRQVEPSEEKMWQSLNHKVRTDIRKGIKSELAAEFGGESLLDEFYDIFAQNMRDLGTPVYAMVFFRNILSALPACSFICVIRHKGKPIAASFLTGYRDTLEATWSCSLYRYLSIRPNMFLYWKILCFAGERGYRYLDFGRSTVGSGTHRFKMQWGSQEVPLYWGYWVREGGKLPELNPENPRYRAAISLWQKLPVPLTKLIGPRIVRCLP